MNVVVTDPHGKPVTGLTKDDFELLDDGKPQAISFFQALGNDPPPPTAQLPPDTYTNQPPTGVPPSVTAILVDFANTGSLGQNYSLQRLRAFLRQLRRGDRVALYVLDDDGLKLLHDFTEDSSDLLAAVRRFDEIGASGERRLQGAGQISALDLFLAGNSITFRSDSWIASNVPIQGPTGEVVPWAGMSYREMHKDPGTVGALTIIARHLAPAPGRKSLVWVAENVRDVLPDEHNLQLALATRILTQGPAQPPRYHGFKAVMLGPNGLSDPADRALRDIRDGLYSGDLVPLIVRLFNDNDIAVYPVSAEGLQTWNFDFDNQDLIDRANWYHLKLRDLAQRTGGRAYYNRNDLETGMQQALDDDRYTYELAYYPHHGDWRGEWRKIEVRLKDPGRYAVQPANFAQAIEKVLVGGVSASVMARGGYFALPEARLAPSSAPHPDRHELLTRVMTDPVQATGLPLTVHVTPVPGTNGAEITVLVSIDAHHLFTADGDNHWKANFELLFAQPGVYERVDGADPKQCCALLRPLPVPVRTFNLDLTAAQYQFALQKGMGAVRKLAIGPGARELCVILHDKNSDALGSVRIPLAGIQR